jgi:hypothetical protein
MGNNIAKYDSALKKPLEVRDQLVIMTIFESNISEGCTFSEITKILMVTESNENIKNLWAEVLRDIDLGSNPIKSLVKTGFFSSDVEKILLTVKCPATIETAFRYLKTYFS